MSMAVLHENVIAGWEPENQQHPDRSSLVGVFEDGHVTLLHGPAGLLQDQTELSVGPVKVSLCPTHVYIGWSFQEHHDHTQSKAHTCQIRDVSFSRIG